MNTNSVISIICCSTATS